MGWWIWVIRSISAPIRNEFSRGNCLINSIESFRSYAKGRSQTYVSSSTSKNVNSNLIFEGKISMIKYSLR